MKNIVLGFLKRGLVSFGFGPIILAVLYFILYQRSAIETLTAYEVTIGIFSLSALAFIAGGMNVIYQIERLPLMMAILIHGMILYVSYLITYLLNGWLELGVTPILVFSCIFIVGYLTIWIIIYSITKRNTAKLNKMLTKKQQRDSQS